MSRAGRRLRLLVALAIGMPVSAWAADAQQRCGAFERLAVRSPAGTCVALLADARDGLRFPRKLLEVAPGRYWITDMGSWEPRRGRLLELRLDAGTGARRVSVLAEALDRPHGLALGPDGKVYVGEAGAVWRTDPGQPTLKRETVLSNLPADGAHPLKELAFDATPKDGTMVLYVNVGSATDACRDDRRAQPSPCPERSGSAPRAAVYRAELAFPAGTLQRFAPHAQGLRNSMALVVTPDGALWQGENSIDYPDETEPPESLTRLRAGSDQGWPYCSARGQPARGYEGRVRCAVVDKPALLLPAHAAPLGLAVAPSNAVAGLAGQLVMSWHGPRATGHRIVTIALDAKGHPKPPLPLVWDWATRSADGSAQHGAPVGVGFDARGRLLFAEDRHRRVAMLVDEGKP